MLTPIKRSLTAVFRRFGYNISKVKDDEAPPDFDERDVALWQFVRTFTMTSMERMYALRKSVQYIVARNIPGSIVECGVWRGGSMMAVARTLMELGSIRPLLLFDTFEGMTRPTDVDVDLRGGRAIDRYMIDPSAGSVSLNDVAGNMELTGYKPDHITYVKGKVEETIPKQAPAQIALLRLDTDWYESTLHELVHLYPRLCPGGVLIIDDYGHFMGARKATDQYFSERGREVLLNRIDYTGRLIVKPG
jgi:hypothetical protein